ncbi:MAG: ATP-binding protein [Candidatus Alkanophagales archaeon]|nr:MAG: ATP-binding protein [Candidatus Alkanophagales archaeon]
MKLVVCGKGGSGKSTVAALIAKELARRGRVLVVDTDESNFGLYQHLGFRQPKDFMLSLGGKAKLKEMLFKTKGRAGADILKEFTLDDLPEGFFVGDERIKLVAIGKIHEFGEGCACPMNVLAAEFLRKLRLRGHEFAVVDTDAGIEHFGRGVEASCDKILVVVDPSHESIMLSRKIADICESAGKEIFFLPNKIDEDSKELLELVDENKVVGILPFKKELFRACLRGEPLPEVKEISSVVDTLLRWGSE